MLKSIATLSLLCLILFSWNFRPQAATTFDPQLSRPIAHYDLAAGSFVEALVKVSGDFRIPMVIEWINTPRAKSPIVHSWSNSTVREILEDVVRDQPEYELSMSSDVANVTTKEIIPTQNFTSLRIKSFVVSRVPVEVASRRLLDLVQLTVSPRPAQTFGGIAGSLGGNTDEPQFTLSLQNVTVEEVLDRMAISSDQKIWIVTFVNSFILTPTGFRRTETLWNNSPVPDDQQPVWDMLHWGDKLPAAVFEKK